MRKFAAVVGLVLAVTAAQVASAQTYNFNVQYFGDSVTTLAPGSDNPVGTNVLPGDSFFWTIQAMNGAYWNVTTGGSFFPLMAFGVDESGDRVGDYSLTLFRNSVAVFTQGEIGAGMSYVHMGTNTIDLTTGTQFDFMQLSYTLTSAHEAADIGGDPDVGINSTISGPLPIFGAPEFNEHSPGIDYVTTTSTVTPEPASFVLMFTGLGAIGAAVRRRRKTTV